MRNKGAILTLAIAFTLVCIYQISFTIVSYNVKQNAKEFAQGNQKKYKHYMDSISGVEVYNLLIKNFTYREVQDRQLNLGLDLKGGMDIILQISTEDIIRSLANYSKDSTFNEAIALAKKMRTSSNENFVTLFGKAFEKIAPNAQLSSIFVSPTLRNEVHYNTPNDKVLAIIHKEANGAISNAFNIIRTRIDQFGVTQPQIQRLEGGDRILVDLPGVTDRERVRKLLQGTANLEFWETYSNADMINSLYSANKVISEYLKTQAQLKKDSLKAKNSSVAAKVKTPVKQTAKKAAQPKANSLLQKIQSENQKDSTAADTTSLTPEAGANDLPLFKLLHPYYNTKTGQPAPGAAIGSAHFKDTIKIDLYLKLAKEKNVFPRNVRFMWSALPITDPDTKRATNYFQLYAIKVTSRDGKAPLDGDAITSASQQFDQTSGFAYVLMDMNPEGAKTWARLTRENKGKVICVVLDDRVYSAPTVQEEITGGSSQITGDFTISEAQDLANLLKSGKLPAPARIVEETVVGPTLGTKSVHDGFRSFIIAFLLILVYMTFYYSRRAGLVADFALVANMFFIVGVLASLSAALTLPGIAGIVLTLGMAVDANVLIFERIREEMAAGKGLRMAVSDGFKHAYSAIIDGNVTTLITGVILYVFGTGPIKGFATTLVIGILTSLFSAIFISRLVFEALLKRNRKITFTTPITKNAFQHTKFDFIGKRIPFYIISGTIILSGVVSLFVRGLDAGVDFKGGRNVVIEFDKPTSPIAVKNALKVKFGETPSVITYGSSGNQVRITTRYRIDDEGKDVEEQIQHTIYNGLKSLLPPTTDYKTFMQNNWMESQKVGPSIASDIKRKAVIAVFLSLVFMFLYIVLRFRNWQYGMGAILALMHDSTIVIGIYSIFWGHMPFSLEIDQSFIAAILTVIGYSINDTVIIFDRLREYIGLYPKRDRKEIMNMALNSTLSRTFSTSFTTIIVLVAIFIFGGEVIRGFVFALMIGIVVGTYSSLFVATPIVFDTVKLKRDKKS